MTTTGRAATFGKLYALNTNSKAMSEALMFQILSLPPLYVENRDRNRPTGAHRVFTVTNLPARLCLHVGSSCGESKSRPT